MTAIEARKLADQANTINLSPLYSLIRAAATKGKSNVMVALGGKVARCFTEVGKRLHSEGFRVVRHSGYIKEDRRTYDYVMIYW